MFSASHYFPIVKKWTKLQEKSIQILQEYESIVHVVKYESILLNREKEVREIYDFIGERRFGRVKREATVMFLKEEKDLIDGAKKGREATKARDLSYQFKNLGRGESFITDQLEKWRHSDTGLTKNDLQVS